VIYANSQTKHNTVTGQETPLAPIRVPQVSVALEVEETGRLKRAA
jgi:hypothetical protein